MSSPETAKLTAQSLKRWLDEHKTLPSFPSLISRLDAVLKDPDVTVEMVADVVAGDVGLVARITKTVNSARYVMHGPAKTLSDAVRRLGFAEVRTLAYAAAFMNLMQPPATFSARQFWRNALVSAVAGRELALMLRKKRLGEFDAATAFMLGLVHDMGVFLLDACCAQQYREVARLAQVNPASLARHEQQEMGINHAVAGGVLLKSWHFPDDWTYGVAGHAFPARLPREHQPWADVLLAAESMAFYLGHGNGVCEGSENVLPELTEQRLSALGLTASEFKLLAVQVREKVEAEEWLSLADEMPL